MKHYLTISHTLGPQGPVFPGNPPVVIDQRHSFDRGDSCNTYLTTVFNHNGTHIDFPRHYYKHGRALCDFGIEELVFEHPFLGDVPKKEGEMIAESDLLARNISKDTDLLLLRTGFTERRIGDSYIDCPILTVEAARLLREEFPRLRALGIDYLSATNAREKAIGEEVHRILLNEEPNRKPVLIIEDMDLSKKEIALFRRVFVVPLFVAGVDSFLCTAFGEYDDGC